VEEVQEGVASEALRRTQICIPYTTTLCRSAAESRSTRCDSWLLVIRFGLIRRLSLISLRVRGFCGIGSFEMSAQNPLM
jgi:hypothetical protein